MASSAAETVTVSEVMLTEFSTLSASETLVDALRRSVQSLQDVFPVVRGPVIVGAITRDTLDHALRTGGNGYVQSAMTRTVDVVNADDLLLPALRRIQHASGAQLLPVLRDDRVVGILTPGNLSQSMALLGRARRAVGAGARVDRNA
jgi:CBS domain-containing protein